MGSFADAPDVVKFGYPNPPSLHATLFAEWLQVFLLEVGSQMLVRHEVATLVPTDQGIDATPVIRDQVGWHATVG